MAAGVGASSRSAEVVGHDPVALLGHARVERAQAGLDVGEPRPAAIGVGELAGDDRRGQRRVRVAVDEHAVRLVLEHDRLEAAQHLAGHRRRGCPLPTSRLTSGSGISRSRKKAALIASS